MVGFRELVVWLVYVSCEVMRSFRGIDERDCLKTRKFR